jgi:hypothetical protein
MHHGEPVVGDEMVMRNSHFHASASNVREYVGQAGPTVGSHSWCLLAAQSASVICLRLLLARSACASVATWLYMDTPLSSSQACEKAAWTSIWLRAA